MRKGSRIGVCLLSDTIGQDAGTERQVAETARRLDKSKFDVHVCCLEPSPQLTALAACCHTAVFPTDSVNSWAGIRQVVRFRRYLRQNHVQIVHAYMNKTAIFAVLSSLFSDRIVITSRLNTGYWYSPAWRRFFRILNFGVTRVMANSEQAKRIAVEAEHLSPAKVDVVYQGVDMKRFRQGLGDPSVCDRMGIPRDWQVVGIVANLRPVKDVPLFLRAAAVVASELPAVAFLVVGRGEQQEELEILTAELGLQNRVFFTRGQGSVMDYLARMSIGCLTSKSEGFSNAILEYMAAGLPVVATDVGGNREALLDGQTGYLVVERTPEALARPLLHLLTHEDERRQMGCLNLERCLAHFELSTTIKSLEDYYVSLLAR
jgi:L-malate glycosyltransferase